MAGPDGVVLTFEGKGKLGTLAARSAYSEEATAVAAEAAPARADRAETQDECGDGACTAACTGEPFPDVACGSSCACASCL